VFAGATTLREKALVEVLYGTGIRTGEVLSLQVRNIDFVRRNFVVRGKRGDRKVLFSVRVRKALQRYLDGRRLGFVFRFRSVDSMPPVERTSVGGRFCRYHRYDALRWSGLGSRCSIASTGLRTKKENRKLQKTS
jgi:integrase